MMQQLDTALVIKHELLQSVSNAPINDPKDLYVKQTLDKLFEQYDWTSTFSSPTFILYDEVITSEILIILHKWLRMKCASIENIFLITTHHTGISQWWKQWCDCFCEKSFNIIEFFFTRSANCEKHFRNTKQHYDLDLYRNNKKITKLFSFYGGTFCTNERAFLTLSMLKFQDCASIDFFSQFPPKKTLIDYLENITFYLRQKEIDTISDLYDQYVTNRIFLLNAQYSRKINEPIDFCGLHWNIDKCSWSTVIRETYNSDCFSTITEKTLRACIYHTVLIPIGFNSVRDLSALGFWFPHDMIDYSYQSEPVFASRVDKLQNSLTKVVKNNSMHQLHQHYHDNIHLFQHNAQIVLDYVNKDLNSESSYYQKSRRIK